MEPQEEKQNKITILNKKNCLKQIPSVTIFIYLYYVEMVVFLTTTLKFMATYNRTRTYGMLKRMSGGRQVKK